MLVKFTTLAFVIFNAAFVIYFFVTHFVFKQSFVVSVKQSLKYSTVVVVGIGVVLVCVSTSYYLAQVFWRSIL